MANSKNKLCKRLSIFFKLNKYRKIGFRKQRNVVPRTLKYNGLKRQYFLGLDDETNSWNNLPVRGPGILDTDARVHATKKKGGILSYLFSVICRFPRKYVYWLLGRSVFRRYYTMPLRLSMSRFVSSLVFRQYYGKKCAKFMRRVVSNSKGRQELAKRAIMHVEQRLDCSILRLCCFKPLFTTKIPPRSLIRGAHKVKSPWSVFSSLQIQQWISHGRVVINTKRCRFSNKQITSGSRIGMSFDRKPSVIKFGSFSQVFYMIYRNMYLARRVVSNAPSSATNIEKDVKLVFDIIESEQSAYLFRPVLSLLKISSWSMARSAVLSRHKMSGLRNASKWNRRSQLQRLLRWKRLNIGHKKIPDQVVSISKQDASLLYSRFSRCYASIVYGTRRCEWVQLQQRGGSANGGFSCGRLYHKTNFLESELEYFQLLIRHYF